MKEETTTQKFKVGQKLYEPANKFGHPPIVREVTIERIGRKFIYLKERGKDYPIDKSTLAYKSPYGSVQFYMDEQELRNILGRKYLWNRVRGLLVAINPPEGLTLEQIRTAALALGVVKEGDVKEL